MTSTCLTIFGSALTRALLKLMTPYRWPRRYAGMHIIPTRALHLGPGPARCHKWHNAECSHINGPPVHTHVLSGAKRNAVSHTARIGEAHARFPTCSRSNVCWSKVKGALELLMIIRRLLTLMRCLSKGPISIGHLRSPDT